MPFSIVLPGQRVSTRKKVGITGFTHTHTVSIRKIGGIRHTVLIKIWLGLLMFDAEKQPVGLGQDQ